MPEAKKNPTTEQREKNAQLRRTTILTVLIALLALVAVSYAWFTLSDNGRINMMRMNVTAGISMAIDLDAHDTFEEYVHTLYFPDIADRIRAEKGYDMREVPLQPVTTSDGQVFTFQNGTVASNSDGTYLEFTLHFMAMADCWVHLTENDSNGNRDGTRIWSDQNPNLGRAMRISFTSDNGTIIYDPGGAVDYTSYTNATRLFHLDELTDKPVLCHVWIEGTDELCNNDLKGLGYSIQMRFEATDDDNKPITARRN